jgi:MFS family permease
VPHADERHNFLVLTADGLLFFLGMIFISFESVLPVFLARLGAPRVVIGLIPVVIVLGVNLPSIVAARLVERRPAKRPYIVRTALWQRIPWGIVAILIPLLAVSRPGWMIFAVLLAVLVTTAAAGLLLPAFFYVVSVTVPVERRGTLFALRSVLSYLFGLAGGLLVQIVLSRIAFPGNYSLLYGIATVILFLGLIAFSTIREPPGEAVDRPMGTRERIKRVLGSSRSYRAYLVSRGFLILAFATTSFFPVYIVERFALPDSVSGIFAMITAGTFILVNPIFGRIGNRAGYRPVVLIAFGALVAAGVIGLSEPGQFLAYALIACTAVAQSVNLLTWNMTVEFAPPAEVPSYVGVTGLFVGLIGPISVITGLIVDWVGFAGLFVMALVTGAAGFLVMLVGVEEPRVMQRRLNQPDMPI